MSVFLSYLWSQNEFEHKTVVFFTETIDVEGSGIWYDWHFKVTWILCLSGGKKTKTHMFRITKKLCWYLKSEFFLSTGPAPAVPYSQVRWLWLCGEAFPRLVAVEKVTGAECEACLECCLRISREQQAALHCMCIHTQNGRISLQLGIVGSWCFRQAKTSPRWHFFPFFFMDFYKEVLVKYPSS